MIRQKTLEVVTQGRGFYELTEDVQSAMNPSVGAGMCHLFLRHTSASLLITENADPDVLGDLERWMRAKVPDGFPAFRHIAEGNDDMPAHVRSVLAGNQLGIPVAVGRMMLGTWQGIFLWEHRLQGHRRQVVVSMENC